MFVKVWVHYGTGPRSHPLDLLVYDSQCWSCSISGECNAKVSTTAAIASVSLRTNKGTNLVSYTLMSDKFSF